MASYDIRLLYNLWEIETIKGSFNNNNNYKKDNKFDNLFKINKGFF